jgi:hypothetical protein
MTDMARSDGLRVSIHEHEIQSLMDQYPKLTRTEVVDVIGRHGPVRTAVEFELERISAAKR